MLHRHPQCRGSEHFNFLFTFLSPHLPPTLSRLWLRTQIRSTQLNACLVVVARSRFNEGVALCFAVCQSSRAGVHTPNKLCIKYNRAAPIYLHPPRKQHQTKASHAAHKSAPVVRLRAATHIHNFARTIYSLYARST